MRISLSVTAMLFLIISLNAQDLSLGLVGYYSFCDCNANDQSGNANDGTIIGSPDCVDGVKGEGFQFNMNPGNNDCGQAGGEYVMLPEFDAIWEDGISICAWVGFQNVSSFERIVDMGDDVGELGGMPVWFGREGNSNTLTLESWVNTDGNFNRTTGRLSAANTILNGQIALYCATIEGPTMKLYVNGTLVAEKQGNPIQNVPRQSNFIGRSNWCTSDPDFEGFMDEVRIYNRALSIEEIQLLYDSPFSVTGPNVAICEGESIELLMQGAASYEWSPDLYLSSASVPNPIATPDTTIQYTCTLTFPDGCSIEETILVEVDGNNDVTIIEEICEGFSFENYTESGVYTDTFSSWNNCDSTRILELTVVEAPRVEEFITICSGEEYNGFSESGIYTLLLPASGGCDTIKTIHLTVNTFAVNEVEVTNTTCGDNAGSIAFNRLDGFGEYDVLLNGEQVQIANNKIGNLEVGDYILTLIDNQNCSFDTTFQIQISDCPIFIPNVFSPNFDGVNDYFRIYPKDASSIMVNRFLIFSRWGEVLYSKNRFPASAATDWWDGTFKGKVLGDGAYVYFIEVAFGDNIVEEFKGMISIIK